MKSYAGPSDADDWLVQSPGIRNLSIKGEQADGAIF